MQARRPSPATYSDLANTPEGVVAEIVGGVLHTSPRPAPRHLSGDAYVPDLAGWRRERLPALPDTAALELAPDWVCEVASPSTQRYDRVKKLPAYAKQGFECAWLVHPTERYVEVHQLVSGAWQLVGTWGEDREDVHESRMPPFDALPIDLRRWWA